MTTLPASLSTDSSPHKNEQKFLTPPSGAGIGLRRSMLEEVVTGDLSNVDFMEVAPENWIGLGGRLSKKFRSLTERVPFSLHGLSLSIGGPADLDVELLKSIKAFMREHNIEVYTEHLSYCGDFGQLYDLIPIPFTEEAVAHVSERIKRAQDILECRIGLENVSYYAAPHQVLSEIDFFNAVVSEADCGVLLDVNNIYVNSINHGYDPKSFLSQMPGDRVMYLHVAGHYNEADDLKVDTHGADVIDPVWDLLKCAYQQFGVKPTLLERDFNIPTLPVLIEEMARIKAIQSEVNQESSNADNNPGHRVA